MPLIETKGAASAQGFGEFTVVGPPPVYIEDVFSTYLYTGNSSTQTITNGIDLSTKGGLVWIKSRSNATNHALFDTARGTGTWLYTNSTSAAVTSFSQLTSFNSTGFTLGSDSLYTNVNTSPYTFVSWTFREQPKFFDVVTYTGNGVDGRTISHNLGSTPGFMLVKCTSNGSTNWLVYHRSAPNGIGGELLLNSTAAASTLNCATGGYFGSITSTSFRVFQTDPNTGNNVTPTEVNVSGYTYVAYLFAHNAGGFGLTGSDNVISCGSYVGDGSAPGPVVNLGWEPQWVMVKKTSSGGSGGNWIMMDQMRGFSAPQSTTAGNFQKLFANTSGAEAAEGSASVTSTGFQLFSSDYNVNESGVTYIYIAIRRGPMKVPTSGTSVFAPVVRTGTSATATVSAGFTTDMSIIRNPNATVTDTFSVWDRLRGATKWVATNSTIPEQTTSDTVTSFATQLGYVVGADAGGRVNYSGYDYINWAFRRAPGFFDEVCYTGNGTYGMTNHNLGVTPELVILKARNAGGGNWNVYTNATTIGGGYPVLYLNSNTAWVGTGFNPWSSYFTSTQFIKSQDTSSTNYVAYLFASCPGVSKVGSYTGTGTTQQINCGFTGGSRFVLIKCVDATGDWYVWDSARGIVAGNDPYLLLNSTAAEVTGTDYVDTYSAGFEISSTAPAAINANGGTFIFLAIA